MATLLENLIARRDAIGAELASMTNASMGGKANNPGMVDHVGYKDGLYRELREINSQITAAQGPIEIESYGIV